MINTYTPVMGIKAVKNSKEQALLKASHVSIHGMGLWGGLSDGLTFQRKASQ